MKQKDEVWLTFGILGLWVFFITSMTGASPEFVRHPQHVAMGPPSVFLDWQEPSAWFAAKITAKMHEEEILKLSEDQKAQIRDKFHHFLAENAEIWYELQNPQSAALPEKNLLAAIQSNPSTNKAEPSFLRQLRMMRFKYITRIKGSLTQEQFNTLHNRLSTFKMLHKFYGEFGQQLQAIEVPSLNILPQFQPVLVEKDVILECDQPAMLTVQERLEFSLHEQLQQLQILRL